MQSLEQNQILNLTYHLSFRGERFCYRTQNVAGFFCFVFVFSSAQFQQLSFINNSIENENGYNKSKAKNVRFQEKKKQEALTFSPPRIPKNSPSYLIWSIFTKEREERNRQAKETEQRSKEHHTERGCSRGDTATTTPMKRAPHLLRCLSKTTTRPLECTETYSV